ncbi:MAG TPA: protein kinase [Candidatus Angelobacter sp.]|nr:protein kinase [Candidatus Angelobacter sp.]
MNAAQWAKVKEILDTALDLPVETRASYLNETCGDDPEVYVEVKSLLDSSDQAGIFLQSSHPSPRSSPRTQQAPAFSSGQLVANRFQIVRFIAHGGMGEVYEATDLSLHQNIALKLVRPDMLSEQTITRFKQEVACARRITHPNVCRVFDLEQCVCADSGKEVLFLTMEFLEGETLRDKLNRQGRMTVTETLPIICQMAKALAASHAVGVIHRDLKPSNVILSTEAMPDGVPRAVITDFGVARVSDQGGADNAFANTSTSHGQMIGTTLYMAPEQAEGGRVSPATDIYALGLILYEMLAGRKPFSEKTPFTGLIERLKSPPVSPRIYAREVGSYLESLILSCLEVKPADRIQDATVLVKAVERLISDPSRASEMPAVSSPPVSQLSLAVLPFINLSRDPENEYFSDGLTEELMGALAKVEGLRVVSRNSSFRYRRTAVEFQEIARQLKVSAILVGTVRHNHDRLRVTVKLIDAALGWNIWAEHYDRRMEDIFAVQEEIANTIACELEMKLRTEAPTGWTTRRTKSSDAYDCFLKGLYFSKKRTSSNLERAAENFRQAIALDPKFASAHAALANCFAAQGVYGNHPPNRAFALAKQHVEQALKIDSHLSAAHCTSGIVQMFLEHDLGSAERSFLRAVELDPNYALARQWYGAPCLMVQGRFREARTQLQLAHELDPLSLLVRATLGSELYFERRYDDAIRELSAVVEMDPTFGLAYYALGPVYEKKEMYPEAITALKRAVELTEGSAPPLAMLGRAYALAGHASDARALLADLERLAATRYVSPVCFAYVFSGLHETSLALDSLERAFQWRTPEIIGIRVWPVFDSLHPEPRFRALCKAMGI